MHALRAAGLTLSTLSLLGVAVACSGGSGSDARPDEVDNGFESDDPSGRSPSSSGGFADGGTFSPPPEAADEDASRVVQEADIVKVIGDRLYALSRFGGLAIVDVSSPDRMKLLGRRRLDGVPFEMYVDGTRAFVMLNDFGRWVPTEGSLYGRWIQSSEILALDVATPSAIAELAHYDVPGAIADSRMVGEVAYVVTYQDGYCWGCDVTPATVVTSFKVGAAITKADQLVYAAKDRSYPSWRRSVSATNQRLYIGGADWAWPWTSTTSSESIIQVIDIADPSGKLTRGAEVKVAGSIQSRWQMDEHGGVLRVVTQGGDATVNPSVETFTVASSSSVTPLGHTELVLPRPETLRSVRFDGTRGYAITFERTDPLFTIDLSDPAHPKQAAALEMPGWVFHMEPRGDRLVGFGYADESSMKLAVSLFDVTDLAAPSMLKRVELGGSWSLLPEDQNRIHKAVQVLDDHGLILVPFASYGRWDGTSCAQIQSGIQLIDYSANDLVLRGVAPQYGLPRRSFLVNGRLLAMSDRHVSTYDVTSRDAPAKTGELDLSNPAYRLAELPEHVAAITTDRWTGEPVLSLTPKQGADDASAVGKVLLSSLAPASRGSCGLPHAWTAWHEARIFASGPTTVIVTMPVRSYDGTSPKGKLVAAAIDVTNPAKPAIAGRAEVPLRADAGYQGYGYCDGRWLHGYYASADGSLIASGQSIVLHGSKLAYLEVQQEQLPYVDPSTSPYAPRASARPKVSRRVHVVDFANPAAPAVAPPIDLPESLGFTPLHIYKGTLLTSRWVPSRKSADKVQFFVDRIALGGPAPERLSSVNTPGSLLLVDEPSSRIVTTDYHATRTPAKLGDCYGPSDPPNTWFDPETSRCVHVARDFKLADVDGDEVHLVQTFVPPSQHISGVNIAADRVYVTHPARLEYGDVHEGSRRWTAAPPRVIEDGGLWVIGGAREGKLSIVSELVGDAQWPLAAHGSKVAIELNGFIAVYDTTTPAARLLSETRLGGHGYSSHVLMSDDRAIASLGEWGLQTLAY